MKYNIFSKKLMVFEYEPIVHTDAYLPITQTIYITWSKGCWWLFLLLLLTFYQKIVIVRLYLGSQRAFSFYKKFQIFLKKWFMVWMVQPNCSNDHLYKTTNCLRRPMLSPPKQILMQLLLYKTTSCLKRPATTFFVSQMKKNLSETTTTKHYPAKK